MPVKLAALVLAAGALAACGLERPATTAPIAPETEAAEVDPMFGAPALPEKCREWLEWLIDGNRGMPVVGLSLPVRLMIAKECLGRPPNPTVQPPLPLAPKPPEEADPPAEPADGEINTRLTI